MELPRVLRYFTAMDVLDEARSRESAIYQERDLDPNTSLPTDADMPGAAEIYSIRAATILKAAGAMTLRVSGVDALARKITHTKFPV